MRELNSFSKIHLGTFPTPLLKLENISKDLGCNIFIKRDDMTGLSLGGNKVRKLEYLLCDAKAKGCDYVITTGGAQSNHAMLTAACCKKLGLNVVLILKQRGVTETRGNLLLDNLMGVEVRFVDSDTYDDVYAEIDRFAKELETKGHKAYIVPVGGSVPVGTLGYVECAKELYSQASEQNLTIDRIVCTAGSGGTMAGLFLGTKLFSEKTKVSGISVSDDPFDQIVADLVNETSVMMEAGIKVSKDDIEIFDHFGPGYAIPSKEGYEAIKYMANSEGLFLDPVYTGKSFAGLLDLVKKGIIKQNENVVFMHTGGVAALFAIDMNF